MTDFIKRLGRCLKKASPYGAGICGTAAITACVMCWTNNLNICNKKDIINKTEEDKGNVYDLEKIVKKKAWTLYKSDQATTRYNPRKQKEPVLQLDWDGFTPFPEKPEYTESSGFLKNEGPIRLIFQFDFQNKSNKDTLQKLKTEVETVSFCKSYLSKGYTKGSEVGLSLQAPDDIAQSSVAFSKGFSLKTANENLEIIPMAWVIDELIRIPKNSKMTVSKGAKEIHREFDFEAMIGLEGVVKGTFYDQNKESVATYTIPIITIINELPKQMISEKNGRCYIKINGRCVFKYDVEQKTFIF